MPHDERSAAEQFYSELGARQMLDRLRDADFNKLPENTGELLKNLKPASTSIASQANGQLYDASLSFRNGETITLSDTEPTRPGYVYQVLLLESPVVEPWYTGSTPYAVLCAARFPQYENAWGWVGLDAHAKRQVGDMILEWISAEPRVQAGTWYWMSVKPVGM